METNVKKIPHVEFWKIINAWLLYFDLRPGPKMLFLGDTPEGSGNLLSFFFCLDVAQGHMKGAPNETRTHSCRFASRAC